jgi:formyl-CoA transferase
MLIDPEHPEVFGPTLSDNATGMYAATAILAALHERHLTGRGRRIEVNMLEASMAFMPDTFANWTQMGIPSERYSRAAGSQSFAVRCADGKLLAIHLSTQEKFWQGLLAVLEDPTLGTDPRFAAREGRVANYRALQAELNERFPARPRAEWEERLERADVPFAPINTVQEVMDDPQVAALGSLHPMPHPTLGEILDVECPVLVDGSRPRTQYLRAPLVGEHTEEVLAAFGASPPA